MYDDGEIDHEEFLVLHQANRRKNVHNALPYWKYERLNLEAMREDECNVDFRFDKHDIYRLATALNLPEVFKCQNEVLVGSTEALCICLRRFAHPCRYADFVPRFGRPVSQLCMVTNIMINFIYDEFAALLQNLDQAWHSPQSLQVYANAVHAKGAALNNCWGFVDGTVRPICRPKEHQRMLYNGHKRVHSLKFQSVVTPNGLIANLFGPVEGRRHDSAMLMMSGLLHQLELQSFSPAGQAMCIYGDPAYPHGIHLQRPYAQRAGFVPDQQAFNQSMSQVRVSVEWVFGDVLNYFKFVDFKKSQKIGLSAVGKIYVVCTLLQNALTCLYGNNTSKFFNVQPPTVEEYFGRA